MKKCFGFFQLPLTQSYIHFPSMRKKKSSPRFLTKAPFVKTGITPLPMGVVCRLVPRIKNSLSVATPLKCHYFFRRAKGMKSFSKLWQPLSRCPFQIVVNPSVKGMKSFPTKLCQPLFEDFPFQNCCQTPTSRRRRRRNKQRAAAALTKPGTCCR